MKTAVIAVSAAGGKLAAALAAALPDAEAHVYAPYAASDQRPFQRLGDAVKGLWKTHEGLVFLCASGIAVRAIAPWVASKHTDPAVVVCADTGAFVISLLSGHEGGANGLAMETAACIGSVPVITTASESSPAILPRNLAAGIGCRKGASEEAIRGLVEQVFAENCISPLRISRICTIDMKQAEPGLVEFADALGAPILSFTAEELNALAGDFAASEYVREVAGTDNVCERSATAGGLAGGGKGRLIVGKTARNGVTLAVFEKERGGLRFPAAWRGNDEEHNYG
jgi:cobalt-precorrin 5A hydrolase